MALVELTFADFARSIRAYWWMPLLLALVIGGAGIGYVSRLPDIYRATALLAISSSESSAGSGVTDALGGFSALVGLPSIGEQEDRVINLATLRSRAIAREFVEMLDLMPILYASEWDPRVADWRSSEPSTRPTLWDAERLLRREVLSIVEDRETGLIGVTMTWTDADLVVPWVNSYVDLVNGRLKAEALRRSNENVENLRERMAREVTLEIRQAASALLASELKALMLAESTTYHAFEVIDPPYQPSRPDGPNRLMISIASVILGLLVGLLGLVLIAASARRG